MPLALPPLLPRNRPLSPTGKTPQPNRSPGHRLRRRPPLLREARRLPVLTGGRLVVRREEHRVAVAPAAGEVGVEEAAPEVLAQLHLARHRVYVGRWVVCARCVFGARLHDFLATVVLASTV